LCGVYGPSVMSEGKVQQWVRQFEDGPCMKKIKEVAHLSRRMTLLKKSTTKFVKISVHNFRVISVFSTNCTYISLWNCRREPALPWSLCKMGAQNANTKTKKAARGISLNIPSAVKQWWGEIDKGDKTQISHSNGEMKKTIQCVGA
jgi:hypothetical protein